MRYISSYIVKLYDKSPIWTRSFASTAYGFLKSRKEKTKLFWQCLAELEETQWWSLEKLQEIQSQRLKKLVRHCAKNVPYYQKKFAESGILPSQIQNLDDIKKIPYITKNDITINIDTLKATNFSPKELILESTSGTTGKPLQIYMNKYPILFTRAIIERQHLWADYKFREDWIGILSGYQIVPLLRKKPPFWTKNFHGKQLHLSSYHLNKKYIHHYYTILKKIKIKYLLGYPSSIGLLASMFNEEGLQLDLKAVFLSSEPIYDWQRKAIQKSFKCKIMDFFSQAERVISGCSCGESENMHINLEAGILELSKISENQFNIIGTSLTNYGMPLLRYKLNDITSGLVSDCSCGRKHPLLKPIETKLEDILVTPQGSWINSSFSSSRYCRFSMYPDNSNRN